MQTAPEGWNWWELLHSLKWWRCSSRRPIRSWWLCQRMRPGWLLWTPPTRSSGRRGTDTMRLVSLWGSWTHVWWFGSHWENSEFSTYRVGVADSGHVLTGGSVFHGQRSFIDHLTSSLQGNKHHYSNCHVTVTCCFQKQLSTKVQKQTPNTNHVGINAATLFYLNILTLTLKYILGFLNTCLLVMKLCYEFFIYFSIDSLSCSIYSPSVASHTPLKVVYSCPSLYRSLPLTDSFILQIVLCQFTCFFFFISEYIVFCVLVGYRPRQSIYSLLFLLYRIHSVCHIYMNLTSQSDVCFHSKILNLFFLWRFKILEFNPERKSLKIFMSVYKKSVYREGFGGIKKSRTIKKITTWQISPILGYF